MKSYFTAAKISIWLVINLLISFSSLTFSNDEKSTWSVNAPPGESKWAKIEVTEGTWMNVNVSPNGESVIFDLLGDIYIMPISGGNAVALTQGLSWDMQPKFSPSGEWIAYTSDESGGDNIWIMKPDGTEKRQVTNETFRLLNNPSWSPDGDYLVARKHFTASRSLGAGEIWMYHISGGNGVQLNERPNDQKDLGEPVFTADGSQVLYSRDSTAGQSFEYNKNSNSQIYEIFSIDLHSGDVNSEVNGAGGAVRPTPSPDGKKLAFVRRIRNQSSIFIKDLTTGELQPVYQNLDRDMQETWAIHGVYPNMSWMPNSQDIVFWSGGKIKRLNTATLSVKDIPFSIKDKRELRSAIRFPVEVAPDKFDVQLFRWVTVSPNGKQLVFQALGYLYIQDLPNGKPKRLTKQTQEFEYFPSYSRDGKWITFSRWNDKKLGHIYKVRAKGGRAKIVTQTPGLLTSPEFSPNGESIVYSKHSGGYLTSSLHSDNTGIFIVPSKGGESKLVTNNGDFAHFGVSNKRLFVTQYKSMGKKSQAYLVSMDLNGNDIQERFTSEWATSYKVSPNEKWLAYQERFQVYLTPFVKVGKAISGGANSKSISQLNIGETSASYFSWSNQSSQLHWSLGQSVFSQKIPQNIDEINTVKKSQSSTINMSASYDKPRGTIALTHAKVVTMNGNEVIEDGDIVIEQNRIIAVGKSGSVDIPKSAKVISLKGKTILPGLVDVHWHGSQTVDQIIPQQNWLNLATLAFGVTTIHDPSNNTESIFSASELAKTGQITAPRIFSTGTILYGAATSFTAEVDELSDAEKHLRRLKSSGAISVKSYNQPRRDQRQKILAAARESKIMVVPEGGSLLQHNLTMIVDGHTSIEHSIPVANIYQDIQQLWQQTQVSYTPTMVVAYGGLSGELYWYDKHDVWKHPLLTKFVPKERLWSRAVRRPKAPDEDYNHFNVARIAAELQNSGVLVNLGAHGQREGLGAHWELWMFAQGGMSSLEAIRAVTLDSAKHLGMDGDIGSIQVGKLADLVIIDGDVLSNIYQSDKVEKVVLNGRIYDANTMNQEGNHPVKRAPLFFE